MSGARSFSTPEFKDRAARMMEDHQILPVGCR